MKDLYNRAIDEESDFEEVIDFCSYIAKTEGVESDLRDLLSEAVNRKNVNEIQVCIAAALRRPSKTYVPLLCEFG